MIRNGVEEELVLSAIKRYLSILIRYKLDFIERSSVLILVQVDPLANMALVITHSEQFEFDPLKLYVRVVSVNLDGLEACDCTFAFASAAIALFVRNRLFFAIYADSVDDRLSTITRNHCIVGDGHLCRVGHGIRRDRSAVIATLEGVGHACPSRVGHNLDGGVVDTQVRAEYVCHLHGFAIVKRGLGCIESDLILCLAVGAANLSLVEQLLVEVVVHGGVVVTGLMVAPDGGIGELILAAVGNSQLLEVHALLETEVVGNLVVRVVLSVILHGH